jgi:DNA-directed RNA polymerase specialized sigma24 family protein
MSLVSHEPWSTVLRQGQWVIVPRLGDDIPELLKARPSVIPSLEDLAAQEERERFRGTTENLCEHETPRYAFCVRCSERTEEQKEQKAKRAEEYAAFVRKSEERSKPEPERSPQEVETGKRPEEPLQYKPLKITPLEKCQHGNYVIDGFARCADCHSVFTDNFGTFLESFITVAAKAAHKVHRKSPRRRSLDDMKQSAYLQMLHHLPRICSASNPLGMAFVIAEGALNNESRKAYLRREIVTSQLTTTNENDDQSEADFLDAISLENELDIYAEFWTTRRLNQLHSIVNESRLKLAAEYPRAAKVVAMSFALPPYTECGCMSHNEIAALLNVGLRTVERDYATATKRLRDLLGESLFPNVRFIRPKLKNTGELKNV